MPIIMSFLFSVAFYTILERKLLGYIQIRKGPNKVGFLGIFQPFSDAVKLFNKTLISSENMNFLIFYFSPPLSLFLSIMIISIIPFNFFNMYDNKHNILFFYILSSFLVYSILFIGWSSNSKYSNLGTVRTMAQMISYEVSFFLIILFISILANSFSFLEISHSQQMIYFFWGNILLLMMWLTSCLAETNRSPFDFAEGESELVSGFNVEYMGGWFALIFLSEYSSMLILSIISTIFFFKTIHSYMGILIMISTSIFMIWIRGTLPRFRYDFLMNLNWKIFLPIILFMIPFPLMILFISH